MTNSLKTSCFRLFCFLLGMVVLPHVSEAQLLDKSNVDSAKIAYSYVRSIKVDGNAKTKEFVIRRELTFQEGDSIPSAKIMAVLEKSRMNIFNTKLFNNVTVNIKNWEGDSLDIEIMVVERWYIIPLPIFKLADRNLNEWWRDRGRSLNRIQYGATLQWDNFRGRNERIRITGSLGFYQILDVYYKMPRIFNSPKLGVILYANVSRAKRLPYTTQKDKLLFHYNDDFVRRQIEFGPRFLIRNKIHWSEYVEIKYGNRVIGDTVAKLNPDYFLNNVTTLNYVQIAFGVEADFRNVRAYPTKGWYAKADFVNYGVGLQKKIDLSTLNVSVSKYFTLDKKEKHVTAHMVKGQLSVPNKQPYNFQKGLGYLQDFVRGYEYYVIDGQRYFLYKNEYKYRLMSFRMKQFKPFSKSFMGNIPFAVYGKVYFDGGYVWDNYFIRGNNLRNQWIYGWGAGIDIITYNDRILRIEYSFNKMLQNGLYLHFELPL